MCSFHSALTELTRSKERAVKGGRGVGGWLREKDESFIFFSLLAHLCAVVEVDGRDDGIRVSLRSDELLRVAPFTVRAVVVCRHSLHTHKHRHICMWSVD